MAAHGIIFNSNDNNEAKIASRGTDWDDIIAEISLFDHKI